MVFSVLQGRYNDLKVSDWNVLYAILVLAGSSQSYPVFLNGCALLLILLTVVPAPFLSQKHHQAPDDAHTQTGSRQPAVMKTTGGSTHWKKLLLILSKEK